MTNETCAKKRFLPREGAVDELIDNDEIPRCHLFPERAAGRDGDHIRHAEPFQSVDIGAVRHGGRRMHMAAPVSGQKHHVNAIQLPAKQLIGRCAKGGGNIDPFRAVQAIDVINARAADHGNFGCGHGGLRHRVSGGS